MCVCVCVCVCVRVHACVHASVCVCLRACVIACLRVQAQSTDEHIGYEVIYHTYNVTTRHFAAFTQVALLPRAYFTPGWMQ